MSIWNYAAETKTDVEVRTGDLITVEDRRHRVMDIVPPDSKSGIVGWVVLNPRPVQD